MVGAEGAHCASKTVVKMGKRKQTQIMGQSGSSPPAETEYVARAQLRQLLDGQRKQLNAALGGTANLDRYIRVVLTAFGRGGGKLHECPPSSVYAAALQAAQLGLSVDPLVGEAYLVPRWNKNRGCQWCSLIVGFHGLLRRVRASGEIASVDAGVVYVGDDFSYERGSDPWIKHSGDVDEDQPPGGGGASSVRCAWAIAHFKAEGSKPRTEITRKWQIESSRIASGASFGPWVTHYDRMAQKTALRRLCAVLPMDDLTREAIAREEIAEATGEVVEVETDITEAQWVDSPEQPKELADLTPQIGLPDGEKADSKA